MRNFILFCAISAAVVALLFKPAKKLEEIKKSNTDDFYWYVC